MPMPLFPYAQGAFGRRANDYYADPATRETRMTKVRDKLLTELANPAGSIKAVRDAFTDHNIPGGDKTHFDDHWVPAAQVKSPSFPYVSRAEVDRIMMEGNLKALNEALEMRNRGASQVPLPVSTLWVCNGSSDQFEAVTVVHPGVVVLLMFLTPPPVTFPSGAPHIKDNIFVTRLMRTKVVIDDIHARLLALGELPADVATSIKAWDGHTAAVDETGTFQLRV